MLELQMSTSTGSTRSHDKCVRYQEEPISYYVEGALQPNAESWGVRWEGMHVYMCCRYGKTGPCEGEWDGWKMGEVAMEKYRREQEEPVYHSPALKIS